MKSKTSIVTMIFLASMLTLAFNVQTVMASGTIYIKPDGSVDPPTAPIQRDGNIYTFTDNIFESIVVERDNIEIDGAGYTLQGLGSGSGIIFKTSIYPYPEGTNNVKIRNIEIKAFSSARAMRSFLSY